MMSNNLILVLALFVISDVQITTARLGTQPNNVDVPSRPTGHSKVRKAHHSRRHLASKRGKKIAQQLEVVERSHFWNNMNAMYTVSENLW
mmetsp:Transcript_14135/g.30471  ORF Transcript_14135/g.30471 Transcript_14135/m.30471 type:complete len:90 (-) Transcript_14135:416-685(-)